MNTKVIIWTLTSSDTLEDFVSKTEKSGLNVLNVIITEFKFEKGQKAEIYSTSDKQKASKAIIIINQPNR